jgi:hypothetical protein
MVMRTKAKPFAASDWPAIWDLLPRSWVVVVVIMMLSVFDIELITSSVHSHLHELSQSRAITIVVHALSPLGSSRAEAMRISSFCASPRTIGQ